MAIEATRVRKEDERMKEEICILIKMFRGLRWAIGDLVLKVEVRASVMNEMEKVGSYDHLAILDI